MKVLVIGGIAAGMSIAAKAKRTNPEANVIIIEKEDYISFGACGLPYYIGNQFEDGNIMFARSVERAKSDGIELFLRHEALDIDFDKKEVLVRNLEDSSEFRMSYDKLAIATGAKPVEAFKGHSSYDNQFNITRLYEVEDLKKQLKTADDIIIIGAGFIGLEVAEQLAHLGKNVRIVQRSDRVMRKNFDPDISKMLADALIEIGVKLDLNAPLLEYKVDGNKIIEVVTEKGSFKADIFIEALGFRPNTAFIKDYRLDKLGNGAIVIDEYGRTSIEDVYAAGDCATVHHRQISNFYSPLATYANKMGRLIGENLVSKYPKPYIGGLGSAVIKIGDYGAGVTGLTETQADIQGIYYESNMVKTKNHAGYYPGQETIFIKLIYRKDNRVLLGAQVFGKYGAVERLSGLTVAVYNENTVDELGFIDFAYAPPFASTWDAINVAGNACK